MATTRLMPLHTGKGRTVGQAISAIIDYTENPQKTDGGRLITSWQCDSRIADAEFLFTKNQYIQKTGRVRGEDDVIAYHLRQSFVPGEITPEDANRLGCELAKRFTKGNHAYIVCTHIDKAHIHNHVIWNSTALSQTRKFRNFWGSSRAVRRLNDTICIENGYSIVENPKRHGKSYNKWLGDKKKPSHRERICAAIDDALVQKPDSFDALLELLWQAGYEVKGKKDPSLLGGEQKKSIRMDTPAVEVKDLAIGYEKGKPVAQHLNFRVYPGEIVGVVGKNGCGKSTLARTLCGLQKELRGEVLYQNSMIPSKRRIRKAYLVMQDPDYAGWTWSWRIAARTPDTHSVRHSIKSTTRNRNFGSSAL